MAETLRKGDRVRVTYEGVVTTAGDWLTLKTDGGRKVSPDTEVATVTVLERTPYPMGTLWVGDHGNRLFKTGNGAWIWGSGATASVDDDAVRGFIADGDGGIVYEPPTA